MELLASLGYIGLFASAFLAATILPLSSELVLASLLYNGFSVPLLIVIATLGNVLGSLTNYALGYWLSKGVVRSWFNVSPEDYIVARERFKKYGLLSLCFAWVPVIGDPLTVVAGLLRIRLLWFLLLVTTGKFVRYLVVLELAQQIG